MFQFNHASALFFCVCATAFVTGCGTTATITRAGASPIEAKIVGSDERAIFLDTHGSTIPVDRDEITDIDHPGNVAATIGGIVTAYGIANIVMGASDCERKGGATCVGMVLPAGIGAPIMITGLVNWIQSVNAAKAKNKTEPSIAIVPTISTDKKNEYVGVSAAMRF
ncbi:MAG TPA: hypothetical protein PK156_21690 [Polyangium sp.]|nr:hypothetical protein [Polyangium sp.]